jgi:hypothetical protein
LTRSLVHERSLDATAVITNRSSECEVTFKLQGENKQAQVIDCAAGQGLVRLNGANKIDFRKQEFVTLRYRIDTGDMVDGKVGVWLFADGELEQGSLAVVCRRLRSSTA